MSTSSSSPSPQPESTPPESPPPRRRGAPQGNRNALKHGLYSRQSKPSSPSSTDPSDQVDLKNEIIILRQVISELLEMERSAATLEQNLAFARAISLACTSLTRLIKAQHWIASSHDEFTDTVKQVIADLAREWNL